MDKYEYKVRADEIKDLIAQGEYVQAAEIADTIDWRRVKSVMMLCTISDLYKINRRYEDARNMLLLAYERRPGGRTICYSLCELSIKMEDFVPAVNYYKEFVQVAPKDPGRYILQYKLYEAQDVRLEERIGVLEELKKRDYREKWAYELAYLYHRVGLATRCVEECDELILWFGEGKYVIKAMELKMLHQPLTPSQQEKYDQRFGGYVEPHYEPQQEMAAQKPPRYESPQEAAGQGQLYYETPQGAAPQEQFYYETPQEMAGQGQLYYETPQEAVPQEQFYYETPQEAADQGQLYYETPQEAAGQGQFYYGTQQETPSQESSYYGTQPEPTLQEQSYYATGQELSPGYGMGGKTRIYESVTQEQLSGQGVPVNQGAAAALSQEAASGQPEELDIQVKPMDLGQYNTINLQAEIAAGLREVLEEDQKAARENEITRTIMAPMMDSETESLDLPEIDEVDENDLEPEAEVMEGSEVFFGETGEIGDIQSGGLTVFGEESVREIVPEIASGRKSGLEEVSAYHAVKETVLEKETVAAVFAEAVPEESAGIIPKTENIKTQPEPEPAEDPLKAEPVKEQRGTESATEQHRTEITEERSGPNSTAETVMEQLKRESRAEEQVLTAQPPEEIARVLLQESDGQISLVMPESEQIEKQITGQMNLEDILKEWERMKQENAEKRKEEVRQHVLQHTGEMFTAFDAAVRDGLLEQLEGDSANVQGPVEEALAEEEKPADSKAADKGFYEEAAEEIPAAEPEDEYLDDNEDWDSDLREEPEEEDELGAILKEAKQEVIFEDAGEVEELEEILETEEQEDVNEEAEEPVPEAEEETEEYESEIPDEEGEEDSGAAYEEEAAEESGTEFPEAEGIQEPDPESDEAEEAEEPEKPAAKKSQTKKPEKAVKQKPEGGKKRTLGESGELPAIEREKGKVRSLTKEEKELYGPYIQSRASREQLVQAIDNISMAAYTGNIIITGEEGMDTVSLAKNMIREVQMTDSNFAGKVAKISGQALNKKDVESTVNQLASGALIIQKASGMDGDTAERLHKALQQESFGIIIILEDVKKAMTRFLEQHTELAACFTARMDVESLSNGTLVAFGRKYAREREYSIDDMGILALHTKIDEMQTSDHVVTVLEVKEIVDKAIQHANRKTLKHFFDILFARRYDEEDMIILSERDFV